MKKKEFLVYDIKIVHKNVSLPCHFMKDTKIGSSIEKRVFETNLFRFRIFSEDNFANKEKFGQISNVQIFA